MKTLFQTIRIAAFLFYGSLYFLNNFDLFSCLLGFTIVIAITIPITNKKSEAGTSDS